MRICVFSGLNINKKIFLFLFVFCSAFFAFGLGEKKTKEIQSLIESGSERELKAAFKKYNYLNNTLLGEDKDTLLMHAIKSGRDVSFLKLLVRADVKLRKNNKKGENALFYISRYSNENEKTISYVLSKWGSKRRITKDFLKPNKEGKCAYETALENLSGKSLERLEKYLDPLKTVPVKQKYLEEKGLLTEEMKKQLDAEVEEARKNPDKKLPAEIEDGDEKTGQKTDKKSEEEKKTDSPSEKFEGKTDGENKTDSQEKTEASEETSENTAENTSVVNETEQSSSSENNEDSLKDKNSNNGQVQGKKTSVDIEKKQKEIESLYGKNSGVNGGLSENGKTFLFDYEPEFEDEKPVDNSIKTIELAKIKNPNTRDFNGRTALMRAVKDGNDWEIRSLISSGADVNLKDNEGWSALMFAVRYQNNVEIVKLLLDNGADIYATNRYGSSPLLLSACYTANPEILKTVLASYGGSENDIFKSFILAITSNSGNYASQLAKLQVFIDRGISMNRFYEGKTPLMYACEYAGTTKIIKLLLDNGALYTIRDASGKKAFDYAKQNNKLERDEIYWLLNGN